MALKFWRILNKRKELTGALGVGGNSVGTESPQCRKVPWALLFRVPITTAFRGWVKYVRKMV